MSKDYSDIASAIAANPAAFAVNREEKMSATVDVMCKNLERRHKIKSGIALQSVSNRGYGEGRKMGD